MTKQEFLTSLRAKLQGLPQEDIDERVSFYDEMISDRIDEGENEEEIVASIGNIDDVVKTIAADIPLAKIVKHKMTPKKPIPAWVFILIGLSFPFWLPFAITALVLAVVFFALLWIMVIVTYSVETAFVSSAVAGITGFFAYLGQGEFNLVSLGSGIISIGAAILMVFACIYATIGSIKLTKRIITGIKMIFIKKGDK